MYDNCKPTLTLWARQTVVVLADFFHYLHVAEASVGHLCKGDKLPKHNAKRPNVAEGCFRHRNRLAKLSTSNLHIRNAKHTSVNAVGNGLGGHPAYG